MHNLYYSNLCRSLFAAAIWLTLGSHAVAQDDAQITTNITAALLPTTSPCTAVDKGVATLFSTAEAHNATLATCRAAIREADAATHSAEADRLPDVSASASFTYYGNGRLWNRHFGESTHISMPHYGNNFALKASQVVYAGGAVDAGIRLAEQGAEMTRLSANETRLRTRFLLVGLYLQLHNLRNREQVYLTNAALADSLIVQMKRRREQGVALRNDVTRYELQHEQMLLGASTVSDQRDIVARQLATALGIDTLTNLLPASAFETTTAALPAEASWRQEAADHVMLQRSTLEVDMTRTKEKLERAARLPKVALVAEDHLDGPITTEVPVLNKNINYWFIGVGISYDISSLYKSNRRVRQARLATATAESSHEALHQSISDGVQAACVEYRTACTELRTRLKSVELAQQNYSVVANRYTNGLALVTDLTDAAGVKLDAELSLADARINLVYCYYKLRYAAGKL